MLCYLLSTLTQGSFPKDLEKSLLNFGLIYSLKNHSGFLFLYTYDKSFDILWLGWASHYPFFDAHIYHVPISAMMISCMFLQKSPQTDFRGNLVFLWCHVQPWVWEAEPSPWWGNIELLLHEAWPVRRTLVLFIMQLWLGHIHWGLCLTVVE